MVQQCYADGSGWQGELFSDDLQFGDTDDALSTRALFVAKSLNIKDDEQGGPFYGASRPVSGVVVALGYSLWYLVWRECSVTPRVEF